MQFFSTIASLVACVSAYQVLTPTANSTVAKGSTVNVKFSTVDTDASTFSVYLVNFATGHFPPTVLSLAQDVAQDAGSVNVRIPCSVSSDSGYQLNFINGTNTYVIYAQSADFTLTGDCIDPVSQADAKFTNGSVSAVYQTIVYENPVVWFVQPSNLVAAAAICPPSSQQTVTVQIPAASVAAVTKTVTVNSCPSQAAIVAALAAAQGGAASAAATQAAASNSTKAAASGSVSGSVSGSAAVAAAKTAVPTVGTLPASTGSAGQIGGAVTGLFAALAVMLL